MKNSFKHTGKFLSFLMIGAVGLFSACTDDETPDVRPDLRSQTFEYAFNEGQLLDSPATAYNADGEGDHPRNLTATLQIDELDNGNGRVTVTLNNGLDGREYAVHAHDAADPTTTPNNTPYNETPNGDVFAGAITISGNSGSRSVDTDLGYEFLVNEYEGFLVVHDPTQELSTVDLTTYLILGVFAQDLPAGEANLRTAEFMYDFNTGQLLGDPNTAYVGTHPDNLTAMITVMENMDGTSSLTITLDNTLDGEMYAVHAHDAADPATTPNNTPYNETPNDEIFAGMLEGNGGTVSASNDLGISFNELTRNYEGFIVVHDPTQELSTVDLTTYLILGSFAR